MLKRDLDRIARQLSQELLGAFRSASLDDIAALLPQVGRLVRRDMRETRAASPQRAPVRGAAPVTPRAKRATASGPKAPPVAGAYAELVLKALGDPLGGMRSEELQSRVSLGTRDLRAVLAHLVGTGQIVRRGQARGTRYALSSDTTPDVTERAAEVEVEVDPRALDEMRALLAESVMPLTVAALEKASKRSRDELRAVLGQLVALGLAVREGKGPGSRYVLASQAAPVARASRGGDTSGPPRVVRRAPRAKAWQPAMTGSSSDAAADAPSNGALEANRQTHHHAPNAAEAHDADRHAFDAPGYDAATAADYASHDAPVSEAEPESDRGIDSADVEHPSGYEPSSDDTLHGALPRTSVALSAVTPACDSRARAVRASGGKADGVVRAHPTRQAPIGA